MLRNPLRLHPDVAAALAEHRPVVALESAVVTHGLPRPLNHEVATEMEAAVRSAGAVPAAIAVLDGTIHIGLTDAERLRLAEAPHARKCGRRDLPLALARGEIGGTTVSATAWIAHAAGIAVFATGGIGGVHRGSAFDVSADLIDLGGIPITVVCSGAKSLLDLPATLEVLETHGVTVIGYGTDRLPAFYVADCGLAVPARADGPDAVASVARSRDDLGLPGAVLVTVPVPAEHALAMKDVEGWVRQATDEAISAGITGAAVTPHVLGRLSDLSGGRTLTANRALLVNNAAVAGRIAVAIAAAMSHDFA